MKTEKDLDLRIRRFYQAVGGEVPAAPPAWNPDRPARGSRLTPFLSAAALAIFAIGLVIAFRELHLAQSAPAGSRATPAGDARALSLGAVTPDGVWMVVRGLNNTPPSAGGVPAPEQNELVVSTDGGRTWQPHLHFSSGYDGMKFSADGRTGVLWTLDWTPSGCTNTSGHVACPPVTNALTVYATSDGGRHWTPRAATPWPAALTYFLDPNQGWAISSSEFVSAGNGALYHTSDGGLTWKAVGTMPPQGPNGFTSGVNEHLLTFINASTGWFATGHGMTATLPGQPSTSGTPSGLYLTTDGGRTWKSQTVAAPPSMAGRSIDLGYPQVLLDGTLRLPAVIGPLADPNSPGTGEHYVYSSSDGGLTWSDPVALRSGKVTPMGSEYMQFYLDAKHWWFTANNDHPAASPVPKTPQPLARTTDGGRTWQVFHTPAIIQMMFADPNAGWAEAVTGPDNANILLHTTDGGATWARVQVP